MKGKQEESDADSAYQVALEFGGGLYCDHPTDRAKLRNFRKFVAKTEGLQDV